ncbi:MAG TPA: right-handed parallel beta-helix repeat-containing protein [Dehalococcoidia bacterium]|nr:right-handed parallel beta-helix repeat-containing protein [Dehalococcoidia bacterium]
MKARMVSMVVALVLVFSLASVIIPIGTVSAQPPWYVDATSCPGPGTGTVGNPFCKIQSAIGNASAGDTIIIAAGQYNEHDITINKSLTLRGAGAGSTFVDGEDMSRVFYINNSTVDMSGMTIRNGNVSTAANGGGLYNEYGNVTMTNCTVSGNEAYNGGGLYNNGGNLTMTGCTISGNEANFWGGGIYRDGGEVTLTKCTVSGNTAASGMLGGGIYNNGGAGDGLTMTGCTVSDNKADTEGGGIRNDGPLEMTNCTIIGNEAPDGGGIYNSGNVTMTGCTVSGNDADNNGGGIFNDYGDELTMTGCTVSGNEAYNGGGIYNYGGHVTMTDCTVSGNTARDGNGGGIGTVGPDFTVTMTNCTISGNNASGDGGGIYNNEDEVTLTNCTISGNEAGDNGGGIRNDSGRVDMTNCTVSGNNAKEGGGIYTYVGLTTLTNCTVSNNSAQNWGGGVYNEGTGWAEYVELRCTIIYGNNAAVDKNYYGEYLDIGGESIVDELLSPAPDPLLGPLQDNGGPTETHALITGSPAIDACIVSCNLTTDQRGQPRPADGDIDGTYVCDVGAYERQVAVGGIVEPVDKIGILAPWLGLAALIVVAMTVAVLIKRKRVA